MNKAIRVETIRLVITLSLLSFLVLPILSCQDYDKVMVGTQEDFTGFYTVIKPNASTRGFLILIPGLGQSHENLLAQTDITEVARQNGILTIIATLQDGYMSLGFDDKSQKSLLKIIKDAQDKYDLRDTNFYIGGFSIGGSCAVRYAELANKNNGYPKPNAVFAIDPPLDFERYYNSAKRTIRLSQPAEPSRENAFMINKLEEVMGGSPKKALQSYQQTSPYSMSDTTQQSIRPLLNTPIRLYTEPDVNWWINQRGGDFSGMNALDCSAMINELKRLGNKNAELITTENRGFRKPDNEKHPHSWSIVDDEELIKWLQDCTK